VVVTYIFANPNSWLLHFVDNSRAPSS